jgi:hypothetical protein
MNLSTTFWIGMLSMFCPVLIVSCGQKFWNCGIVKIGAYSDVHHRTPKGRQTIAADSGKQIKRYYEYIDDADTFTPDFSIQLGDIADSGISDPEGFFEWLESARDMWFKPGYKSYYVVGNHEWKFDHSRVLKVMGLDESYYSFDVKGIHNIVLNTCSNWIKNHPEAQFEVSLAQVEWLKEDLASTDRATIVYCHVPLDEHDVLRDTYQRVRNRKQIWDMLTEDGDVIAVIQAHDHNGYPTENYRNSPYNQIWVEHPDGGLPYFGLTSPSHMFEGAWPDWAEIWVDLGRGKLTISSNDTTEDIKKNWIISNHFEFDFLTYSSPARTFYNPDQKIVNKTDSSGNMRWSREIEAENVAVPISLKPVRGEVEYTVSFYQPESEELLLSFNIDKGKGEMIMDFEVKGEKWMYVYKDGKLTNYTKGAKIRDKLMLSEGSKIEITTSLRGYM